MLVEKLLPRGLGKEEVLLQKGKTLENHIALPIPFQETWHVPEEMKLSDIERVKKNLFLLH